MQIPETRAEKKERITKIIENYLSSECTQKEFCHKNSLNPHNFQYWLKRYRQQNQISISNKKKEPVPKGFIPLTPPTGLSESHTCIIEYPNGHRLFLAERPEIEILRQLLNLTAS